MSEQRVLPTPELRAVARAAPRVQEALDGRDNAIRRAYKAGHSLREIAYAAGLSHGGVKKIIDRAQGSPCTA